MPGVRNRGFTIIGVVSALWAVLMIGSAPWYIVVGTGLFSFIGLGAGYVMFILADDQDPSAEQKRQEWIAKHL
jgi:hypothetical protein